MTTASVAPTMASVAPAATAGRLRIAISSPEILARIRHEFASKGLAVEIDGLPSVEVVVVPGTGAAPGTSALAEALNGLAGPHTRQRDPATARYRLALIPRDRRQPAAQARPEPDGCRSLSPREAEVMDSICRGMGNADIAVLLKVRQKTVKNHVNRIFAKLGARNRVEAVLIWQHARAGSA
jgi:DNA-binding CsgD family transcriptional regulator